MVKFEEEVARLNLKNIIIGSILSALGFMVALSWREVVKKAIDVIAPKGEGLIYEFFAALVITIFCAIAGYILVLLSQRSISELAKEYMRGKHKRKRKKQ